MNKLNDVAEKLEALDILDKLQKNPEVTQRDLSQDLDMSLGKVNFLIKELGKKGWVKIKRVKNRKNKLALLYILTPNGIRQKLRLTRKFLRRKVKEYEKLEQEIQQLKQEIKKNG